MSLLRSSAIALLIAVATIVVGCQPGQPGADHAVDQALRVGYQRSLIYLPVFVGVQEGIFETAGVKVELVEFPSANEMMQALLSGHIDVTGMSSLSVVAAAAAKHPTSLELLVLEEFSPDASPDALVVQPEADIATMGDLRGRRIGTWKGSTIAAYSRVILLSEGLSEDEVEIVPMGREEMLALFELGEIDAAFTFEPYVGALENMGGVVLERAPLSRRLLGEPTSIYPGGGVALRSTIEARREAIDRYKDGYQRAVTRIQGDWDRAHAILADYAPSQTSKGARMNWVIAASTYSEPIQALLDFYSEHAIVENRLQAIDLLPGSTDH